MKNPSHNRSRHCRLVVDRTRFNLTVILAIGGLLLAGLGVGSTTLVQAQAFEVAFIEGTIPVSDALTQTLAGAIGRSGEALRSGAEVFAVTDVLERDGWLFVSVVGLVGIDDLTRWNIIDNGVWFSSVIVEMGDEGFLSAAVYGTTEFVALAGRTPNSVLDPQAKQALLEPELQTIAGEDYIFPYPGGYSIHYGNLGVHSGWNKLAVDLGSDGNTALGHAPNYLIASSSGTVTYRCTPGTGQSTTTIIVGEFLYAHLHADSVSWQIGNYVPQGTYLGQMETGTFEENCGYGYQSDTWFHVHFGFTADPLILSGWTLNTSTQIWSNGSDTWSKNTWKFMEATDTADLLIDSISFSPSNPAAGESITATMQVRNAGEVTFSSFTADIFIDREPNTCTYLGDYSVNVPGLGAGETIEIEFVLDGLSAGSHLIYGHVDTNCVIDERTDPTDWAPEDNNLYGPDELIVGTSTMFFSDDFETGDFSLWTRYNDGGGYLYPCAAGAINGNWGACVARGDNDKRKQLIDDTPVNETNFNVRFNFDINGLTMAEDQRFRFMQVKMGTERPFFIVLLYRNGQYLIQLNTLLDDATKAKTAWFVLSDSPHTIEVDWRAASGDGANDGRISLYLDGSLLTTLNTLDNYRIYVDSFRVGFTSRLDGKVISGSFYVDDVATSLGGYIGVP